MTTPQLTETFDCLGSAIEELAASTTPEAKALLLQLSEVTNRFMESMAIGQEAAKFLTKPRQKQYAKKLADATNSDFSWNCYNLLWCVQESLKCGLYKTFRPCDITEFFSKYSIETYEKFFEKFKAQVSEDCKNTEAVEAIHQYSDAILDNLKEVLQTIAH